MSTRTRRPVDEQTSYLSDAPGSLDLEALSDDELEAMLFDEEEDRPRGFLNLPTIAGLSMILVGVVYLLQEMGILFAPSLDILVTMAPWLGGILIILLGMGVLSWRPNRKKKVKVRKAIEVPSGKQTVFVEEKEPKQQKHRKRRLTKSRNKKVAGVAGGIAEYFSIDPTLVRIVFIAGLVISQGSFLLAYIILSFVMPKPDALTMEERITIIRDS